MWPFSKKKTITNTSNTVSKEYTLQGTKFKIELQLDQYDSNFLVFPSYKSNDLDFLTCEEINYFFENLGEVIREAKLFKGTGDGIYHGFMMNVRRNIL